MNTFTPISSIISPIDIAKYVSDTYAIDGRCRLLKAGVNHSYQVTTPNDKYVFRVYSYNWRSSEEISAEIELLKLLEKNNLPVSFPLPNTKNQYINILNAAEGNRFGVLFSYAKGEKVLTFGEAIHFKVGETMANMHELTKNSELNRVHYNSSTLLDETFEYLGDFLSEDSEEYSFMLRLKSFLETQLGNANVEHLRKGVVHLDIWFDNMNISTENITIFDFDFCGNGWLCLDPAYYILQIHSTEANEADYLKKKEAFLNGYQSVTELTREEIKMLPILALAIYVFYIGVQCKRFNDWSNSFLNELYLKRYINLMVKRWFDFNKLKF